MDEPLTTPKRYLSQRRTLNPAALYKKPLNLMVIRIFPGMPLIGTLITALDTHLLHGIPAITTSLPYCSTSFVNTLGCFLKTQN